MIKRSAFTIIELLVSIMIIGILATFGYQQYTQAVDTAKAKGLVEMIKKFNTGISSYFNTYKHYPEFMSNGEFSKIITEEMEFETAVLGSEKLVMANLGPRVFFDLDQDFSYDDQTATGNISSFRYIVIRNVPSKLAALALKEINGVNNNDTDCQLINKNWFGAIVPAMPAADAKARANLDEDPTTLTAATTYAPHETNDCVAYDVLMETTGGHNVVDLYYTFSRSIGSGNSSW